jgi:lysine biosynthesis protein LysW
MSDVESGGEVLVLECPVCAEELELTQEDLATLEVGNILVCESCEAEIEVTSVDPPEFELLGPFVECPSCGQEIELDDDVEDGMQVQCPNCGTNFAIDMKGEEGDFGAQA